IIDLTIDNERWNNIAKEIQAKMGSIPVFIFIDWAHMDTAPMGVFSQKLTPEQQKNFLKIADDYFKEKKMKFIYPVYGGYMGDNSKILSFGISKNYDSLAPEFQTCETIKELSQEKSKRE
ncbi:MAG: hypothetical protein U9R21_04955, partial [Candidatus Thermoplasmatota archaeon]|nr:hypothetical protein [Candidatus Thermoplasmatota archaeon]